MALRWIAGAIAFGLALFGLVWSANTQEPPSDEESQQAAPETRGDTGEDAQPPEQRAVQLLKGAQRLYHEGKWYRARAVYDRAYELAPEDSPVRVHAALGRSTLLWEQGNYAAARERVATAMDLAKELNLDDAIGRLLLTLGHIEASEGTFASAEETLRHCVRLAAEQDDAVFGPLCKLNHRLVRKLQGKSIASESSYRKALEQLESVDSPLTVGLSLSKTAELYAEGGQQNRAFNLLNRAEKEYEKAGSVPAQARNRMLEARMYQETGEWGRARKLLQGLADTFQGMGSKPALVESYGLLGNDAQHRRAFGEARTYYQQAFEVARATGSPQLIAKVRMAMCELGAKEGDYEGSVSHCKSAIDTFGERGMSKLTAAAQSSLGSAAQTAGQLEEARQAFIAAEETLEEQVHARFRNDGSLAHVLANLCQVEMHMQIEGGLYRCRKALDHLDPHRDSRGMIAATHYARGNAAANEDHPDEAAEQLEKAAEMFTADEESADYRRYADAMLRLGAIREQTDAPKEALDAYRRALDELGAKKQSTLEFRIKLRTKYTQLLLHRETWNEATSELQKLVEESDRADDVETKAWALSAVARAQTQTGDQTSAREALERALPLAKKVGDQSLVETIESNLETLAK